MTDGIPGVAAAFAVVAALIHAYIFVLESLRWTAPRTRATFGNLSPEQAATTKDLAYNQGFYNLFLAIGTVVGLALSTSADAGTRGVGVGMVLLATGSMVAAALVLWTRNPSMVRAVAVQGIAPLVAIVLTVLG
ncbi:MAG: DUF1304 domain-containing protein [Cellulomonadaceae bacterium]|nr:DUF1304 domain-containing protein [Cellulomonadaceae bacterium]